MAAQVSDLIVFDFLTSNPDRYSGGNMKMSEDGKQLFFMDNTMSFYVDGDGNERNREVLYQDAAVLARAVRGARQGDGGEHAARARRGAGHALRDPDAGRDLGGGLAARASFSATSPILIAQHGEKNVLLRRCPAPVARRKRPRQDGSTRAGGKFPGTFRAARLSRNMKRLVVLVSRPRWPPVSPVELPKPVAKGKAAPSGGAPDQTGGRFFARGTAGDAHELKLHKLAVDVTTGRAPSART